MKIACVTIFPELFNDFTKVAIMGKAIRKGLVSFETRNPRDFADGPHRAVDDTPYGGGAGMVMMAPPLVLAIESIEQSSRATTWHRILLTPRGQRMRQSDVERWSQKEGLLLVAGRYEGIDERVHRVVHEEVSIGDYVLMGGEVAAMTIIEAVTRLVPFVLGNPDSTRDESHSQQGIMEYPQYTRPLEFRGERVPEVLLNGNHQAIQAWREQNSRKIVDG